MGKAGERERENISITGNIFLLIYFPSFTQHNTAANDEGKQTFPLSTLSHSLAHSSFFG